jgi:hypothetical protein
MTFGYFFTGKAIFPVRLAPASRCILHVAGGFVVRTRQKFPKRSKVRYIVYCCETVVYLKRAVIGQHSNFNSDHIPTAL